MNSANWGPVDEPERYTSLDLVRGFALSGVLLVNLLYFFRISLFAHIFQFHSHDGWLNHAIDFAVAEFVEFKAFGLFSLTFGVGVAVQAERAASRGVRVELFLARRFLILLAVGACHMVLVSNVDILMLYALCGLLMIPVLRLPAAVLAIAGIAAIYLPSLVATWPSESAMRADAVNATRIYSTGGFWEIVRFRWSETRELIVPILRSVAQNSFGMMLLGAAVWRCGAIREPERYRLWLWTVCGFAGAIGLINTTAHLLSRSSVLEKLGSHVPLAIAYGAGLLAWRRAKRAQGFTAVAAAAGQMALTNYLTQSVVLAVLFYGYGFGLFGRLEQWTGAAIGVVIYGMQVWFSAWWMARYRFGPFEWAWRSMTYGRWQPMRRFAGPAGAVER